MPQTTILGLNSAYHEDSCSVIVDGELLACVEEERFNRVKHGKRSGLDGPTTLPYASIDYCLGQAGVSMEGVDWIGYSYNPARRLVRAARHTYPYALDPSDWGSRRGEARFYRANASVPEELSRHYGTEVRDRFVYLDHHLCHAASAFYPSGFKTAAVLVVDGIGEEATTWLGRGDGPELHVLEELEFPASLGLFYERLAEFCGFSSYDASYLMGLAGYGKPSSYTPLIEELLPDDGESFGGNDELLTLRKFGEGGEHDPLKALEEHLGVPRKRLTGDSSAYTPPYTDIAWAAQHVLEERLVRLTQRLHELTGEDSLCVAGGVALNCVANWLMLKRTPFKRLSVHPAANDAGTALGAALLLQHELDRERPRRRLTHAYWGPSYDEAEIEEVLRERELDYTRSPDIASEVAALVADGAIVAWFQGRMEWGPRALGNRSLIADPRRPEMREVMNVKVKHREEFRPFCPTVLREEAPKWFEIPGEECQATDFMLCACPTYPDRAREIPAVVHVDGTARIQTVSEETNPLFTELIRRFHERTGVPILLNTSFNDSEPIVCTPSDAIDTFEKTRIDYLALGPFLISAEREPSMPADTVVAA